MWTLILFKNSSRPVSRPFAVKTRQMETGLSLSGRVARMRICVAWSMPDGSDILAVEHVFHSCLIEARHREGARSIGSGEAKNRAIRGGVGLVPDKREAGVAVSPSRAASAKAHDARHRLPGEFCTSTFPLNWTL